MVCLSIIVLFLILETAVTNAVTTASGITTNGPQFSRMVEMVQELVSNNILSIVLMLLHKLTHITSLSLF